MQSCVEWVFWHLRLSKKGTVSYILVFDGVAIFLAVIMSPLMSSLAILKELMFQEMQSKKLWVERCVDVLNK